VGASGRARKRSGRVSCGDIFGGCLCAHDHPMAPGASAVSGMRMVVAWVESVARWAVGARRAQRASIRITVSA
jgi:hypothetical protein